MKLTGADAPMEIVWDTHGIPHVYAKTIADAYRGMGYAAGKERLWQIHQSTAYALGEAAALLGEKFLAQDAIQRACNVHGDLTHSPRSNGDWIVDAYLEGLNTTVSELDEIPPEFVLAGATPRSFDRRDVAARYRFTSWIQHKTWTEKMLLGRLMSTHGCDHFRNHVLHFSADDEALVEEMKEPLGAMAMEPFTLAYPAASKVVLSGSNNWAVTGKRSTSGKPLLATDPHQPHLIPNTFFYIHLHAPGWDVFGAAFPGVPYFMMGATQSLAWGLTTGFIDNYDIYVEKLNRNGEYFFDGAWHPLSSRKEEIQVRGGPTHTIEILATRHGPLLENLCCELDIMNSPPSEYATSLRWSLASLGTSAGALAQLPLSKTAEEFGHNLFEDDVCPLVNNIICVDKQSGLRRFIAATLPARSGITGTVPLPGWKSKYSFRTSTEAELTVEIDPSVGYALTANNDTLGESGPYCIHNFPAHSARADRIREILESQESFSALDFQRAQLDLKDLRAASTLPDLIDTLNLSEKEDIQLAAGLLSKWDCIAHAEASAPCLFYPFQDRLWARKFMFEVLGDPAIKSIGVGAPGLSRFDINDFMRDDSPWRQYQDTMTRIIHETMTSVVDSVKSELGEDVSQWRWGDLHQIQFSHRLQRHEPWAAMQAGPDRLGGSATTLGMAMHMGPGPGRSKDGEIPCRVFHGPAFRMVVDLADPEHIQFVIAGGNGGRAGGEFATNQYPLWLEGKYLTINTRRDELNEHLTWKLEPKES